MSATTIGVEPLADPGPWMAFLTGETRRPQTDTPVHLQNSLLDIDPEPTLKPGDSRARGGSRLQQSAATSTAFNNSFYPRTIRQWNQLPVFVTDATSLEGFKTALANHRATPSWTL